MDSSRSRRMRSSRGFQICLVCGRATRMETSLAKAQTMNRRLETTKSRECTWMRSDPCRNTVLSLNFLETVRTSDRQVLLRIKSVRSWFSSVQKFIEPLCSVETADIVRLNVLDGSQGLREIMISCFGYSFAADASSNIHNVAYLALRVRLPPQHSGEGVSNLHVPLFQCTPRTRESIWRS